MKRRLVSLLLLVLLAPALPMWALSEVCYAIVVGIQWIDDSRIIRAYARLIDRLECRLMGVPYDD